MTPKVAASQAKRAAALAALGELPATSGGPLVIGLGTGSTVRFFLEALAERVSQETGGLSVLGVPTSVATRDLATRLGIPMVGDEAPWPAIAITVDGADEIDPALALSKGGGGALTREKLVSFASERTIIVADASKAVAWLGATRPIAIEVLRFGRERTIRHLAAFGQPVLRLGPDGVPFVTDNGGSIVDLALAGAVDPAELDRRIRAIPGVVETGIFVGRADVVLLSDPADPSRIERRER